jgi:hypothetical protein
MSSRLLALVLFAFGAVGPGNASVIIPLDSTWKFLKGYAEASSPDPTAWRAIDLDESTWLTLPAPFWYGDVQPSPGSQLTDMLNGYTCVFMRGTFALTNVNDISELELGAQSDDGFIAWINGQEVARFNMPQGDIPFSGTALPALPEPIPFQNFTLTDPRAYLVNGTNVLAVQAFNSSLSQSSDFVINVSLSNSVDTVPPTVAGLVPAASALVRSLNSIEVQFSEPVTGVDAGDLLLKGVGATNVSVFNSSQYVFEFSQPANGTVQAAWAAGHGIRDLANAPNDFAGGSWIYTLDPNAPVPGVMINEFMADNDKTLNDENGDASDWIEIYNSGTDPASLNGWFLTNEASDLRKWRIPNVTLSTNSYLVIFASGKNRTNAAAQLHTNFKLEKNGSYLALLDPATNIVSAFTPEYPSQNKDVSYGRERGNPNLVGYFPVPTPGGPNSTGGPGFAPEVRFSRPGGTFISSFSLVLSTPSPNAEIRYTLDGSVPTNTTTLYTGPIPISIATQVRARAFEPGLLPGPPRSESYILLGVGVINVTSDLPMVIIYNYRAGAVPANAHQFAYMAIFEPVTGKSSMTNTPVLSSRAGINLRGSSTLGYPKSSFAVEWWDEFNDDKNLPVLDMPANSDWILYAPNNFEPVLIHNPFIYGLSNEIGRYAPRARFVEVYLNTSGGPITSVNYNGIYVLEEKIKRGKDRVDVAKLEPEHAAPPEVTGGYMMKIDRLDPGDSGFFAAGQVIAYVDPKETEITLPQRAPQQQYINDYMNAFGGALNNPSPTTGYPAYVDVDSWIDHHILNVLAFNVDALRLSAFFYKERNGKLVFGPLWDFDRALGSTDGRDSNPRVWRAQTQDRGTDFFNYPWWGEMFNDIDFWQKWIDRWQELRRDRFALTNINAKVDSWANIVRQEQPREQAKWGVTPRGGSYQSEVNLMKSWLSNRINFIDTNFLARPLFNNEGGVVSAGFQVTLNGPPGATIYYTLDGSEPRSPGGAIAPTAQIYSGPITINNTRIVKARARDLSHFNLTGPDNPPLSTPWSGVMRARFSVNSFAALGSLAVTEINYNPGPPVTAELAVNPAFANEDFEFIEVKNITNIVVDFYDARFTRGIDFTFSTSSIVTLPPGASLLLVKNQQAFNARYGTRTNVAGVYTGNLNNGGEILRLENGYGLPILEFEFKGGWYPTTDGNGFSLVLVDQNPAAWSTKAAWHPSANPGGSPGVNDPTPPTIAGVLVNEALTHTDPPQIDSVELFNPTANPADVSGWFLTDDLVRPRKFRIPDNTPQIPADGYRVFTENDFSANSNPTNRFRLSSLGDQVYLFSTDASGNLRWYAHGFDFGAAENGVSFGRLVTSDGNEQFVAQSAVTLNTANAPPKVGPIVINEIMYHPPDLVVGTNLVDDTDHEFIELHNITDTPQPLFHPGYPTNTWRLRDAVDYTFPTNITLPARGYLLLIGFDPIANPPMQTAFRTNYNVPSGVPIYGPYSGKLDNSSGNVELIKPDIPQQPPAPNAGFVPYILVDRVNYSDLPPWPTAAAGTNYNSLQRWNSSSFGNEPTNWFAAVATAGIANTGSVNLDRDGDGLPNDWEIANNLDPDSATGINGATGDPDNDGLTNLQEYVSGTDPRDAASYLKINSILADSPRSIRFNAVAGKTYTIQYRQEVDNGVWQKLVDVAAQGVTGEIAVTDSNPGTMTRFYRLVTPATP